MLTLLFRERFAFMILFSASATMSWLMLVVFLETNLLRDFTEALATEIKIILLDVRTKTAAALALLRCDAARAIFGPVETCEFGKYLRLAAQLLRNLAPIACCHLI